MMRGPLREKVSRKFRRSMTALGSKTLSSPVILLLLLLLLSLFVVGIALQLPPPKAADVPSIFTSVAYSTVLSEARQGRLLAVHLQGTALNGLRRAEPFPMHDAKQERSKRNQEIADFLGCLPEVTPACFHDDEPRFPRERLISTMVPVPEQADLVALLMAHQVVLCIAPASTVPSGCCFCSWSLRTRIAPGG